MQVLITVATKHGATSEIGDAIAEVIRSAGHEVVTTAPPDVETLEGIDAVVLGSAVYIGRWLDPARHLVGRLGDALATRPVWLVSSGPAGEPPTPESDPEEIPALVARLHARGHRTFAGRIDRHRLGLAERAIVAAVRAPDGDFRPWPEIRTWAAEIARELSTIQPAPVLAPLG